MSSSHSAERAVSSVYNKIPRVQLSKGTPKFYSLISRASENKAVKRISSCLTPKEVLIKSVLTLFTSIQAAGQPISLIKSLLKVNKTQK